MYLGYFLFEAIVRTSQQLIISCKYQLKLNLQKLFTLSLELHIHLIYINSITCSVIYHEKHTLHLGMSPESNILSGCICKFEVA